MTDKELGFRFQCLKHLVLYLPIDTLPILKKAFWSSCCIFSSVLSFEQFHCCLVSLPLSFAFSLNIHSCIVSTGGSPSLSAHQND
ncbi:hypothetical protein PGTUg99_005094 [Puccinia graminis f. sp. tritici]|uniref:Uncharacterized protein n=1 Tax=Puccinia graminis f. sp. tritici TaxID=56615 RepID=A0A5B0NFI5_PUCGR|nr:hypothetical protein PGTUg99_005094 [Puccinia graminis f. sp. tritici]